MPIKHFAGVVLGLYFSCCSLAVAATDQMAKIAWQGRLVTMGPACGLREASWSTRLRTSVAVVVYDALPKQEGLFGAPFINDISREQAEGALQMAEDAGRRLVAHYGQKACNVFASPSMLAAADQVIDGAPAIATAPIVAGGLDADDLDWAWLLNPAQVAVSCGQRPAAFMGQSVTAYLAMGPHRQAGHDTSQALLDRIDGASSVAAYVGAREVALNRATACADVRADHVPARLAATYQDMQRNPAKYLKGLAGSD